MIGRLVARVVQPFCRRWRSWEDGQVLVIVALVMTVFILLVGLVVDYGFWMVRERELRAAADAAAQAGSSEISTLPVEPADRTAAATHAMLYLNDQLQLGLAPGEIAVAATHAVVDTDGFGSEDGTSFQGLDRFHIDTPSTAAVSCTGRDWGIRSITVRIDHQGPRFFSRIAFEGTQLIQACATSAVGGGGYAVAVLKPPPSPDRTQTPNNSNMTLKLAGTDSFVRICGGDVAVNSLFSGGPEPPPQAQADPANIKFMKPNSSPRPCLIDNDNTMFMTIDQPNPPSWSEIAKQIRIEGDTSAEPDDVYRAPEHLRSYVAIPGWGAESYADLVASSALDPMTVTKKDPGNGDDIEDCTPPEGYVKMTPGKYDLMQTGTSTDEYAKRWLCPGVYYFVNKTTNPTNPQGLQVESNTEVAGEGVTLVFEYDSEAIIGQGAALILNLSTEAAWQTTDPKHDVPLSVWIRPMPLCDPLSEPICDGSKVFIMKGGAGIDIRGVIFGPTDNMKIAGNSDHHGAGELWAWTIDYLGNSQLDQTYEGGAEGYPVLVE